MMWTCVCGVTERYSVLCCPAETAGCVSLEKACTHVSRLQKGQQPLNTDCRVLSKLRKRRGCDHEQVKAGDTFHAVGGSVVG